jgi:hypothetical protein
VLSIVKYAIVHPAFLRDLAGHLGVLSRGAIHFP